MPVFEKNKQISVIISRSKSNSDDKQYSSLGFPSHSKYLLWIFACSANLIHPQNSCYCWTRSIGSEHGPRALWFWAHALGLEWMDSNSVVSPNTCEIWGPLFNLCASVFSPVKRGSVYHSLHIIYNMCKLLSTRASTKSMLLTCCSWGHDASR